MEVTGMGKEASGTPPRQGNSTGEVPGAQRRVHRASQTAALTQAPPPVLFQSRADFGDEAARAAPLRLSLNSLQVRARTSRAFRSCSSVRTPWSPWSPLNINTGLFHIKLSCLAVLWSH